MGGRRPPYLLRREGTYYFRIGVPLDLRLALGVREVKRTLRVYAADEARLRAQACATVSLKFFERLRLITMDPEAIKALAADYYRRLAAEVDRPYVARFSDVDAELREQQHMVDERLSELEGQLGSGGHAPHILRLAEEITTAQGLEWETLDAGTQVQVCDGLLRAMIEQAKIVEFRLRNSLDTYVPQDPLFRQQQQRPTGAVPIVSERTDLVSLSVGDVAERFLIEKERQWEPRTASSRKRYVSFFVEHVGAETPIRSINAEHIRTFMAGVERLHRKPQTLGTDSFAARQTSDETKQLKKKTAINIFAMAKQILKFARKHEFIDAIPGEQIDIQIPKAEKWLRPRRPFTTPEFRQIFSSPPYAPCLSPGRRFDAGEHVLEPDGAWWLMPILMLTGARLGEIVQLQFSDIDLDGEIPTFHITDVDTGSGILRGEIKKIKTISARRHIPMPVLSGKPRPAERPLPRSVDQAAAVAAAHVR